MDNNKMSFQSEKLSLIVAICAVFISAASFYATFIQADAAEKQVRAMTLPLLSYHHGNWIADQQKPGIVLWINNGGVGPAVLHKATYIYKGKEYAILQEWLKACCSDAQLASQKLEQATPDEFSFVTSNLRSIVIPGQDKLEFLKLDRTRASIPMFNALDEARHQTAIRTCYCSLLDECYEATGLSDVTPVNAC